MKTTLILTNLSLASALFPVIATVANYKTFDKTLKIAAAFFIISALFDLVLELLYVVKLLGEHHNNYPAIHLFIIISILFYGNIYYRSFYSKQLKNITVAMAAFALAAVIFFSVKNSIWIYPSISNTVLSVFLIPLSLLFFYQLLNQQEFVHIEKQPMFWINSGVLIYF